MRLWLLIAVLLIPSLPGCEGGSGFLKSTPSFYPTAKENYDYGVRELKGQNWLTAIQYFHHVKTAFGFSKWATLAELGLADADVGREKYTEAIDGYKQFIKSHPSHEHVQDGYAAYRIGESYHKQIPSDWFLAPPSYEKDLGPVHDALRELTAFTEQYGDSPYAPKARKLMGDCVQRLTDHELYVARFYLDRDKPYAAIGRLEGIVKDYPGAKREPETLLMLGKTYMKMEKFDKAREVFSKLSTEHPEDYRAQKAKLYIDFIDRKQRGPHG
jgi:outer membrane protein assembly factor BamD